LYLTAYGPDKKEIFTWSWAIHAPTAPVLAKPSAVNAVSATEIDSVLMVKSGSISYEFSKTTGYLQKVLKPSGTISLSGGPVLAGVNTSLKQFAGRADGKAYIIEADYQGDATLHIKWTFSAGHPAKLEYQYTQQGDVDFMGITFNYPEEMITGMKWLGRGPYRVWKTD
jgi:hypothetical protein